MVCTVNPKPQGPRRIMIGGLRLVTRGLSSRQGDVSREDAVEDPPGDSMDWPQIGGSSRTIRFVELLGWKNGRKWCFRAEKLTGKVSGRYDQGKAAGRSGFDNRSRSLFGRRRQRDGVEGFERIGARVVFVLGSISLRSHKIESAKENENILLSRLINSRHVECTFNYEWWRASTIANNRVSGTTNRKDFTKWNGTVKLWEIVEGTTSQKLRIRNAGRKVKDKIN